MFSRTARRALMFAGLLAGLASPGAAQAWTVTVNVHGAGKVEEVTPRKLMNCTVATTNKSNTSETACVAGAQDGPYASWDIVELAASVPTGHYDRGWRFSRWVDSTAGGGKINCDDTGGPGQPPVQNCKFQIFENLEVDLHFVDVRGPQDTEVSGGPALNTNSTSASFTFNSPSEAADARYQCKLDRPGAPGSFVLCGNPNDKGESYGNLAANGQYTFSVRALDPTGNWDESPATHTWTVDTVAPSAAINGSPAPGAVTNVQSYSLEATTNDVATTLLCTLDGSPAPCKVFGTADEGEHTFTARAQDAAGNLSPLVTRSWTVDITDPVVTIAGEPGPGRTKATTAALTATTSQGSVACTFDGEASPCTLDASDLPDGAHTFSATGTDPAGNTAEATRTWTVDTTGPVVTFTKTPAATTNETTAQFAFSADETATFQCSLDQAAYGECAALEGLSPGSHTFRVRATDDLGNLGEVAEFAWTIDVTAPDTALLAGPAEGATTAESGARFEFASPESGTTFECRLDGAAFAACSSPLSLAGLTNDDHVFEVRARDAAGNVDATPARRAWRVNALDADADGVNRPADCRDDDPAIRPGAADAPGDGVDQDCSGADAAVPVDLDRDDDGVHTPLDCDDSNPAIRPGATDTPQDGVDQNCAGGDAAFPTVAASLAYKWGRSRASTPVLRLLLSGLTADTRVKVTCKGRRCPVRSKTAKPRRGRVDVRKLLKRKPLRPGWRVTITITRPGHVSKVVTFKARRRKSPTGGTFACLAPGAKRAARCA